MCSKFLYKYEHLEGGNGKANDLYKNVGFVHPLVIWENHVQSNMQHLIKY